LNRWVIDCSFSAALFLPDENTPAAERFFSRVSADDSLFVPSLWWTELANLVKEANKREQLQRMDILTILSLFGEFKLITDTRYGPKYAERLYEFAATYKLSGYDAVYLELALREKAAIATFDPKKLAAADIAGIKTVGF
jgi:predicted nucleic acid-binding protein